MTQVPLGGAQYLKTTWNEARNRPDFLFVAMLGYGYAPTIDIPWNAYYNNSFNYYGAGFGLALNWRWDQYQQYRQFIAMGLSQPYPSATVFQSSLPPPVLHDAQKSRLQQIRERGYPGGISQLKAYLVPLKRHAPEPVVRFESLAPGSTTCRISGSSLERCFFMTSWAQALTGTVSPGLRPREISSIRKMSAGRQSPVKSMRPSA